MKKYTIEYLKDRNLLCYRYLRGSWCHGIAVPGKSDYDYGGVFFAPKEMVFGLPSLYMPQVSDEKNDEVYYEFGRWMELLLKSNPTCLESLFVDSRFVIGDIHPAIRNIIDNRNLFLSKECFNPLIGYVYSQSKKSVGYNKKSQIPENFERKDVLDFCYTFKWQGSQPMKKFLEENGLDQRYAGLVNIPNMEGIYGVYYDFAAYAKFEGKDVGQFGKFLSSEKGKNDVIDRIGRDEYYGYSGIVHPEKMGETNEVRLSSIPKDEKPICHMYFNQNGYMTHCRQYKEWSEWKRNRNQERYSDNKGYNFDAKNMCEMVRLLHTGIEIVRDGVYNVERTWDRDYLLDIKNHRISYEEIMEHVNEEKAKFDELVKVSTLPDRIDVDKVNELMIETRKELYG